MSDIVGYARVSRDDQNPAAQQAELHAAEAVRVFVDHGESSRVADRPQWLAWCLSYPVSNCAQATPSGAALPFGADTATQFSITTFGSAEDEINGAPANAATRGGISDYRERCAFSFNVLSKHIAFSRVIRPPRIEMPLRHGEVERHHPVAEVSRLLGMSRQWVSDRLEDSTFVTANFGMGKSKKRIPASSINAYIVAHTYRR